MGRKTSGPIWVAGLPNQIMQNKTKLVCILLCFFAFLPFLKASAKGGPSYGGQGNDDYDSVIVFPKEQVLNTRRMDRLMRREGIIRFQKIKENAYVIPLDESDNKEAKISELKESGLFELVEPDYKFSLDSINERNYISISKNTDDPLKITSEQIREITPNDRGFVSQYYLREINATKAWNTTVGNSLLVGILDTGVDANHPDLAGKVLSGIDLTNDDITDDIGHGTEVAGIIAANTNNNQGIAGIAWNTKILPVRVTDGAGQAKVSTVVQALDLAYRKGAKIVQISLSTSQFSEVLKSAIEEAQDRDILVISTGGNTGVRELRYPAAFDGVIGVGAVGQAKRIESYSTTGNHVTLVAPGSSIYTTTLNFGYSAVTGTSFSAPQVAGTAALVWSLLPDLSSNEVREILIQSAEDIGEPGRDPIFGYGLLNTEKAVSLTKALENNIEIKSWITK